MREQMVGDGLVVREHVPIWPWKPCLCAARGLAGVGALMPTDHSRLTRHASPPSRRRLASHRLWREHDVIKSETYRRQVQSQLIRRAARARSATRQKQNRSLASRLPTSRQRAAPRRAPLWSAARLRGGPAAPDSKPHRAGLCRRRRVCQAGPPPGCAAGPHRARPASKNRT